jgi:hypothetical protein
LVRPRTAANEGSAAKQGRPIKGSARAGAIQMEKSDVVARISGGEDSDGRVRAMGDVGRR